MNLDFTLKTKYKIKSMKIKIDFVSRKLWGAILIPYFLIVHKNSSYLSRLNRLKGD